MNPQVLELYPAPGKHRDLHNLYLDQIIARHGEDGQPFFYSNYITSLDGRIALPAKQGRSHQVPAAIANPRDWRLFQELAAQADLLITSARYFRQAAIAEAQSELPLGSAEAFDDLRAWRLQQGMKPQPDIAIFSASLDIPVDSLDHYRDRRLYLFTGAAANPEKLEELSSVPHLQVVFCGEGETVDGSLVRNRIARLGYLHVYAVAGPSVLHTLVNSEVLDRLYLTTAHCLLGGSEFDTIAWGPEFSPARAMPLRAIYLDTDAPEGCGQTMAIYGYK